MLGKKVIISYTLSGKKDMLSITRKIYGYIECSKHNKYKYQRKGILSDITFEKIAKGCFMIESADKSFVVSELKKLRLKPLVFVVDLLARE
jgi:hypothetical protein